MFRVRHYRYTSSYNGSAEVLAPAISTAVSQILEAVLMIL